MSLDKGLPLTNLEELHLCVHCTFRSVARVAEPGTATELKYFKVLGVEPRDRKNLGQASCWPVGPRGFKSHPGRLFFRNASHCLS